MASRFIAQMIVSGVQIVSRAFITAYQQALRNAKAGGGAAAAGGAPGVIRRRLATDEALKIMNIERAELTAEAVEERYQKYFSSNDPAKGGSFYLQSKIVRSKEALLAEINDIAKGKKDGEIPNAESSPADAKDEAEKPK